MPVVRGVFAALMVVHGLIHSFGFFKAFGLVEFAQINTPISRPVGILWLVAGIATWTSAIAVYLAPRSYWISSAVALVLSQGLLIAFWNDAKAGTAPNVLLLVAALYGFSTEGPLSFRAQFERAAAQGRERLSHLPAPRPIREADLDRVPPPVAAYIRRAGFLGQPETRSYELLFSARMRSGPSEPWMTAVAEQASFTEPPTRLFLMRATRFGLPVQAFHHYHDGKASFQVRLLGVVPLVDERGPELDRTETVTLFNDMCLLAPATLLSPQIQWEPLADGSVRAHFSNGKSTISALLEFDEAGFLRNFISDDRRRLAADGKGFSTARFSTPLVRTRSFGAFELTSEAEARWDAPPPEGSFAYGEFRLESIRYNARLSER